MFLFCLLSLQSGGTLLENKVSIRYLSYTTFSTPSVGQNSLEPNECSKTTLENELGDVINIKSLFL